MIRQDIRQSIVGRIPRSVRRPLRQLSSLGSLAWHDIRQNALGQIWPMRPTVLSLMANDICNSRCEMCLIWKQKRDTEITPEQLKRVLSGPFFQNLEYVGITGGEPTLRKDLPELFRVCCQSLPSLRGMTIITNAIQERMVIERILASAEICKSHDIPFAVMVSLDGLDKVHDRVRGRDGNFSSAIACLEMFRKQGLQTSFGCTITASNAADVDELIEWAAEHDFYGRFRVAEYIDRLYNQDVLNVIRSFDRRMAYHLGLFYFRLEAAFEPDPMYRKTYRSIRGMLAEGKRRQTGCPYQTHAVVMSTRGELMYCSPKSPNLGNILETPPEKVYFGNLEKRRKVIKEHCSDCIHDYHDPMHLGEKIRFWLESQRRSRKYDCRRLLSKARGLAAPVKRIDSPDRLQSKHVLIVGWYGTETIGDKAILWSVVARLRRRSTAPVRIAIASLYPFVTRRTLEELRLNEIDIVETYTRGFEQAVDQADEVVIGGGPLMDLEALNHMLYAYCSVRERNGVCRIEGCGVGPLVDPRYIAITAQLFRLADYITVRDRQSRKRAAAEFGREDVETVDDPAVEYVNTHRPRPQQATGRIGTEVVATFLREWSEDYAGARTPEVFKTLREAFEHELAGMLAAIVGQAGGELRLYPMHCFHVGNDDRVFNRRMKRTILAAHPDVAVEYNRLPVTPDEIVTAMSSASLNVCMRFHSVVFASTLGVPFVAIDYTNQGKIWSFLSERGQLDRLLTIEEIASGAWRARLPTVYRDLLAAAGGHS